MRLVPACVVIVQMAAAAAAASAQTFKDLQVRLGAYTSNTDGGEKPVGVWFSTGPVAIGKSVTGTFSVAESCDAFAVSSDGTYTQKATAAWKIEVTAARVVREAVTFRLRWQMASGSYQSGRMSLGFSDAWNDIELTLRPGESWPVVRLSNIHRYSCAHPSSIRVSVDSYPWEEDERRLLAADLWLIERLANGTEASRSQPLSVRGLPNRPLRFYFDSIVDANNTLDIYGVLTSRLKSDAIAISVETRSRWTPQSPSVSGPQRSVKSDVEVKPNETVEIRLPLLGDDAGGFGRRAFSIRIRARQLR